MPSKTTAIEQAAILLLRANADGADVASMVRKMRESEGTRGLIDEALDRMRRLSEGEW